MSFRKPFHMPFRKLIPQTHSAFYPHCFSYSYFSFNSKTGFKLLNGQDEASRGKPIVPIVVFAL